MSQPQAVPLALSPTLLALLQRLARRQTADQRLVRRAAILLTLAAAPCVQAAARRLGLTRLTVRNWRDRWLQAAPVLQQAEQEQTPEATLLARSEQVLADAPRPGAPATFSPEQIVRLVAVACEPPEKSGRPTANVEVWCGWVIAPTLGPTRTEADFLAHVQQTVATDPAAGWVFIVDNLNTHQSESLVVWVAQSCGLQEDVGGKGKSGVLKSQASRMAFLSDKGHRIRFVYTPKHTSWLNQVELWFSILVRKLLRRASFRSVEELKARVLAFIDYFNRTMAKPIRWLYSVEAQPANETG